MFYIDPAQTTTLLPPQLDNIFQNWYDLVLISIPSYEAINKNALLRTLSERQKVGYPILIKHGDQIKIYGIKDPVQKIYELTHLNSEAFKHIIFPEMNKILILKRRDVTKAMHDEITSKKGHISFQNQIKIIISKIDFNLATITKPQERAQHCATYVVEIFRIFSDNIQRGKCISGDKGAGFLVANGVSLISALSEILNDDAFLNKSYKNHTDIVNQETGERNYSNSKNA